MVSGGPVGNSSRCVVCGEAVCWLQTFSVGWEECVCVCGVNETQGDLTHPTWPLLLLLLLLLFLVLLLLLILLPMLWGRGGAGTRVVVGGEEEAGTGRCRRRILGLLGNVVVAAVDAVVGER